MSERGLGPFVVGIGEQRRARGHARSVTVVGNLPGLVLTDAALPEDAEVIADLFLEILADGHLTATGVVRAPWEGTCRRCLQAVAGDLEVEIKEVFEPTPSDDAETYPLGTDRVDLEPLLRDAILLALPIAPLCRSDCPGPDPDEHPVSVAQDADDDDEAAAGEPPADPRWAALGDLRFD